MTIMDEVINELTELIITRKEIQDNVYNCELRIAKLADEMNKVTKVLNELLVSRDTNTESIRITSVRITSKGMADIS